MAHLFFARYLAAEMEEEDRREARLYRRTIRDSTDPFSLADAEFKTYFRLSKDACIYLIDELGHYFDTGRNLSRVPVHLRLLSAIHFFATGNYQRSIGSCRWACLSQPMVSRAVKEVSNLLIRHLLKKWVCFPKNMEEKKNISDRFAHDYRMPLIIGVIDGTHVSIIKPSDNEHVYINRKGYHSINVQIICDDTFKIINIVAMYPGSTDDSFIWNNSRVGKIVKANYENGDYTYRLMGDSGYPCQPWLITPLNTIRTAEERRFNDRLKTARSVVERCIGHLKGRFRCLLKHQTLHYTPEKAAKIILSCAILHNIAVQYKIDEPELMWDEMDLEDPIHQELEPESDAVYRQLGQESRRNYIQTYF